MCLRACACVCVGFRLRLLTMILGFGNDESKVCCVYVLCVCVCVCGLSLIQPILSVTSKDHFSSSTTHRNQVADPKHTHAWLLT